MLIGKQISGTVAIMAGVPAILEPFSWSYARLVEFNSEYLTTTKSRIHYIKAGYSDHAPARNDLVNRMQGDWLLQLDTDLEFAPDLLYRMLDRMARGNLDVLTGLYRYKDKPCTPVLYCWDKGRLRPIGQPPRSPIFEVAAAGGGCLLVRRRVFERIANELGEPPFDRVHPHSEDLSFFYRLRRLGIPAYCDQRIELGHLKSTGVQAPDSLEGLLDGQAIGVVGLRG